MNCNWRSRVGVSLLVLVLIAGALSGTVAAEDGTDVTVQDEGKLLEGAENGTTYSATSSETNEGSVSAFDGDDAGTEQTVAVTVIPNGSSFKSDETMNILVGAFNNSGFEQSISGTTLEVTVQRPDQTTWESSVTTGPQGNAQVDYDLSNDNQNGTYEVTVTDTSSAVSATVNPDVGSSVIPAERDFEKTLIGENHELSFLVRNGQYGAAGEQISITVEAPDNTVVDTQVVETDSDGFANITVTPTEPGFYDVEAEVVSTGSTAQHGFEAGSAVLTSDYAFGEAVTGEPFVYGGYLEGANGLLRNEPVQVVISNESTEVANISTTTDNSGFLLIESQIDNPDYYDVNIITESGSTATAEDLDVTDAYEGDSDGSDSDDSNPGVELDITSRSHEVAPGSNATFDIEAMDNGTPIANEQIQIFARLDYDGVPLHSGTITTNESGLAVIEIPTPADIDGADIDGQARLQYNGSTYEEDFYSDIQQYDLDIDFWSDADVGSTATFDISVEATDGTNSVANLPVQYNALRGENGLDTYASGELVTDQSGQAEESVAIPRDLRPDRAVVPFSRYENREAANTYYIRMFDFPGTAEISGASGETDYGRPIVQPGDQITVNFTTDNGSAASGLAFTGIEHKNSQNYAEAAIADEISTDSNATLTIPEYAEEDSYQEIQVWTADSQGLFYVAEVPFEIDADSSTDDGDSDGGGGGGGEGGSSTVTASVSGEDVTVAPGQNTTVEFSVTNTGEVNSSYILNLSLPEELTPIEYTNASGTVQDGESKWLWQTLTPGETVTPSVTVQADSTATGTYSIGGEVLANDSIVAETSTTVTVSEGSTFELTGLTAPSSASVDTPFTYTAEVTNTGGESGTQTIEAIFDDDVKTREVTLNASEQTTLAFTSEAATSGVYDVTVSTANDTRFVRVDVVGQEFIRGQSTGDPHITTYGGVSYDFMAAGDFVLATEPHGDLHVVARQAPVGDSISNNNATATTVGDARVVIDAEATTPVSINGSAVSIADGEKEIVDNGAGEIRRQGSTYTVYYAGEDGDVTATDEHLTVDVVGDRLDLELALHPDRNRSVEGLLGNTTAAGTSDIAFDNGTALARPVAKELLYEEFRSDWRATGDANLFTDPFYIDTFPEHFVTVDDLTAEQRSRAEAVLADTGLKEGTPQYRDALIDVALTGDSSYIASAQKVSRENVSEADTALSIPEAIDTNDNNEIDDQEILAAIDYWQTGEAVPGTDGERIGDFKILGLIKQWRYNNEI